MSHKDQDVLGCWGHRAASRGLYFFCVYFFGFSIFFCKPGVILGRLQGMLLKALQGCCERHWLGRYFFEMLVGSAWGEYTPQLMSWNKVWKKSVRKCILCAFYKGELGSWERHHFSLRDVIEGYGLSAEPVGQIFDPWVGDRHPLSWALGRAAVTQGEGWMLREFNFRTDRCLRGANK